ncbi:MAG TPA: DciA family protein [Patescibacteria group bacterium]|nr:DciA family protein [Patescibacteria group bacterium]
MRPIGGAIDRALRKLGLERDIARVSALDAWPDAARDVFGPSAGATRAVGLSGRALVVAVPDATWSGEIRLREAELVAAIGRRAASDIEHIRTVPATERGR